MIRSGMWRGAGKIRMSAALPWSTPAPWSARSGTSDQRHRNPQRAVLSVPDCLITSSELRTAFGQKPPFATLDDTACSASPTSKLQIPSRCERDLSTW